MPILVTFLLLTVISGVLVLVGYISGNRTERHQYTGYNPTEESSKETERNQEEELRVEIHLPDCSVMVGTVLNVSATVYPSGGSAVSWLSSNEKVCVVDTTGRAVVVGAGIAVLTASLGSVNDTVIIEGVEALDNAVLNLPAYNENLQAAAIPQPQETRPVTGPTSTGIPLMTERASEAAVQQPSQQGAAQQPVSQTTQPSSEAAQQPSQAAPPVVLPTAASPLSSIRSSDLPDILTSYGFERHIDGTYVYEKDDICYGEVVLDSDKTHLYVIRHGDAFDLAAISLLAQFLPQSYENVWKTADKASSDITMTADGRTVRVVVPMAEGHKQLVIFN